MALPAPFKFLSGGCLVQCLGQLLVFFLPRCIDFLYCYESPPAIACGLCLTTFLINLPVRAPCEFSRSPPPVLNYMTRGCLFLLFSFPPFSLSPQCKLSFVSRAPLRHPALDTSPPTVVRPCRGEHPSLVPVYLALTPRSPITV